MQHTLRTFLKSKSDNISYRAYNGLISQEQGFSFYILSRRLKHIEETDTSFFKRLFVGEKLFLQFYDINYCVTAITKYCLVIIAKS